MMRFLIFVLVGFLFMQTPFYKKKFVPYFKKVNASLAKLLEVKPESLHSPAGNTAADHPSPSAPSAIQDSGSGAGSDSSSMSSFMGSHPKAVKY